MGTTKKVLTCVLTMVMLLSSVMCVFAGPSRTGGMSATGENAGSYEIGFDFYDQQSYNSLNQRFPEVATSIQNVNKGSIGVKEFFETLSKNDGEAAKKIENDLKGKEFFTGFANLKIADTAVKNANGKYEVTISVPSLTDSVKGLKIVYYDATAGEWKTMDIKNIDYKNKTVTAEFDGEGIFALIADEGTVSTEGNKGEAPKTEGTSTWMMWSVAAVVLAAAGTVVFMKKRADRA